MDQTKMPTKTLSPREEQIVQLCMDGFTNDAIAHRLGISVGTVNTYWVRIKLKVGGSGRTETIVRVIKERAETALRESNNERIDLGQLIIDKVQTAMELRTAMALLELAMSQIQSAVWAVDKKLTIQIIANGELPSSHFGVKWEVEKTVYEIFKTEDPKDLAVAAHIGAIAGKGSEVRLVGEFKNTLLRVMPLTDEHDESIGCISILNMIGENTDEA